MNHNDIETTLCAQRWRDPPPEFLQRTLAMALAESRQRSGVLQDVALQNRKPRWLALLTFIPRPLRLPLAACWLLALFFKLTTPESIPQSTLENYAKVPPVTPA